MKSWRRIALVPLAVAMTCATLLLSACATLDSSAQERDILDAAAEHPLGYTFGDQPMRFGDPNLDGAEKMLRNFLPRPWTTTRIQALFEAARTRLGESMKESDERQQDQFFDWMTLMEQLGTILAASRDPRAALTLGRLLESSDDRLLTYALSSRFMDYFGSDASYQRPPAKEQVTRACYGGCGDLSQDALKWWQLNRRDVEQRAAAITAALAPCANCERKALATIDQLRARLRASAPTLHVKIEGGGMPRYVQVEIKVHPISGESGGAGAEMNSYPAYSSNIRLPDILLRIPATLLGRDDMRLSGMVISPGYRSVPFELDHINDARVVPITLVPVGSKTLTGTIAFAGDAPRPFGLRANLRVDFVKDPSGVLANSGLLLQNIAEATVDQDGHFSIVVPDVTQDPILNVAGVRYELAARNYNWVLLPNVVALDHPPGTALDITVAPRPGSAAATNASPGPLLPVTGRVIDADGRPVPAAQVVIVNNNRLNALRCPENGDACFPAMQATGMARALGVSGNDGSFTLQVPVGLMSGDSVWAEGRDASGKSIRTSWAIAPNRELPTSTLGDIRLDQRLDFRLVVRGDGQPIAGAEVDFGIDDYDSLGTQRTDGTGAVEIHQQIDGSRDSLWMPFAVRAAGFASETWDGGIPKGTTTQVIELVREAVQRGRVVDAGGRALVNVTVQAHAVEQSTRGMTTATRDPFPNEKTGTARTDDTGAFTLRGLHGGRQYRLVVVSAEGAVTSGERIVTAGGAVVDIVVPAARSGATGGTP